MTKPRSEVPKEDRWNVEAFYPSYEAWEKDITNFEKDEKDKGFSKIIHFRGSLHENPENIQRLFDEFLRVERHLNKLHTYAHLRHDEDVGDDHYKKAYLRVTSLYYDFKQATSWIEPEILLIPEKEFFSFLKDKSLEGYRILLEKLFRIKPHTLSSDKEELLALAGQALESSQRAFSAFNNGDLRFPDVKNEKGESLELTHGKYQLYLRSNDRVLRENTYKTLHKSFSSWENTLCEMIHGQVQTHVFDTKARKYSSCLEDALFPHQIDTKVYTSLIETVRRNLSSLHRYMEVRKKLLGFSELHLYDMSVPLVPDVDLSMNFDEARKLIIDSVSPLGKEYQNYLEKGLGHDRWVDKYENLRKRSGAYSSGCYDSMPYILMNYHGTFQDVMTLTHEAGHSMHSFLSAKKQPYHYSRYPIFVAEVASTFHEDLLFEHLMHTLDDPKKKVFLINQKLDDIRATFFRQAMFAEFELKLHNWVESGIPITPLLLKTEYRKLNIDYFGKDVIVDEEADIEWARIPHFYYNFYVYQYATGISAAHALCKKVRTGKEHDKEAYLHFLSSGGSDYPINLLKNAGVDMLTSIPTEMLIRYFDDLVERLKKHLLG